MRGLLPVLWLLGLVGCILLWRFYRSPEALQNTPTWWLGVSAWLGTVVYQDDPALALRVRISRLALVWTVVCLGGLLWLYRAQVANAVSAFARMRAYPLSLAIFRIAVFYQIYNIIWIDVIVSVAALPAGLQYPLATGVPDVGWLSALAYWPVYAIPPEWVERMLEALKVVCWLGILGVASRSSALAAAFLLTFGWGSIQWFGKVDHHHHLVWFALLLAASRCGDALSVDSLIHAWRRAGRGITAPPGESRAYGLPLALAMTLLGVAYFFPGFWKYWRSGLDWAFGDGPLYTLYSKWQMMGGEVMSTVDQQPWLLQWGSLGVMLLELSFLALILTPWTRLVAAVGGLSFHLGGNLTGRYGFESLMGCYVIFVKWGRLFRWFGGKLFPADLVCLWTPGSRWQAALLGVVRSVDVLGRVDWRPGADERFRVEREGRTLHGVSAYRAVAARVPALWPTLPLALVALPSFKTGGWTPSAGIAGSTAPPRAAVLAAGLLIAGNLYLGVSRNMNGWPVACYPLFDGIQSDSYRTLRLVVRDPDGERELVPDAYRKSFGNRWNVLLRRVLATKEADKQRRQFALIWDKMTQMDPTLSQVEWVRFFSVESSLRRELWSAPPTNPKVLFEADLPLQASTR